MNVFTLVQSPRTANLLYLLSLSAKQSDSRLVDATDYSVTTVTGVPTSVHCSKVVLTTISSAP